MVSSGGIAFDILYRACSITPAVTISFSGLFLIGVQVDFWPCCGELNYSRKTFLLLHVYLLFIPFSLCFQIPSELVISLPQLVLLAGGTSDALASTPPSPSNQSDFV